MYSQRALQQYQSVGLESSINAASPHQLVTMLFNGALERIAAAKGHIERNEVAEKGQKISRVIAIVDTLRASLDHNAGGELSQNLHGLYDYMERRLMEANLHSNPAILDEVAKLIREIKEGWDGIPEDLRHRGGV